jgi:hypothetical protein
MRVAAVCRKYFLNAAQSIPYQDPIQPETTREADVLVRFGSRLSGVDWTLTAVIECKFPKKHPWAAILNQRAFDLPLVPSALVSLSARLTSTSAEKAQNRLTHAWGGFAPFAPASFLADSLVSVCNDKNNEASSALRQALSAAEGIHRQYVTASFLEPR